MKKIFLLVIIILLSLNFVKIYADCPQGYTERNFNATYSYTYPSGGGTFTCHVTIVYCCKWDNNLKEVVMEITEVKPQTSGNHCLGNIPNIDDFMSWLHTVTANNADDSCAPAFPPCDDNSNSYYIAKIFVARCWYYKNLLLYEHDDIYSTIMRICPYTFKCKSLWKVCFDYNYSPPELSVTFISKIPIGTPTCSTTVPTLPPSGKTWEEYWETGCFSTECN